MDLYLDSGVHLSCYEPRNKEPHVVLDMIGVDKSYMFWGNIMLYYFLSTPPLLLQPLQRQEKITLLISVGRLHCFCSRQWPKTQKETERQAEHLTTHEKQTNQHEGFISLSPACMCKKGTGTDDEEQGKHQCEGEQLNKLKRKHVYVAVMHPTFGPTLRTVFFY